MRRGDENRINTSKYLENAKNKALSVVNNQLFCHKEGEIGLSEVTIKLMARLAGSVKHITILEMAENIKEVRAKLELQ